ncbi:MAG: hypothetical protein ABR913_05250 [Sedimentisphaerales bacterium]|jgi:hypothetical protein
MGWGKISEREDQQGGVWKTYKDEDTNEKIITRESPNSDDVAIFKDGEKVNRKTGKDEDDDD